MNMDLNYIKKLIKMLDTSSVSEIEIEEQGTKLKLSKPRPKITTQATPVNYNSQPTGFSGYDIQQSAALSPASATSPAEESASKSSENLYEVLSPMVGTFYRSPAPDADAYVKVGDSISTGSVLCIIEAMKLMNEIESEVTGKVVKILVENAQPVEYNQPLFLIEIS